MRALARILLLAAGASLAPTATATAAVADDPPAAPPPTAQIDSGPPRTGRATQATFSFSGSDGTTGFECSVDTTSEGPCSSPFSTTVGDGDHHFTVHAIGESGPGPDAARDWTVDAEPPVAPQPTPPVPAYTSGADLVLTFAQEDGVAYDCRLDVGAYARCSSPTTFAGLSDGWHTFAIRGSDAAGNGPTTLGSTTIDTVAPVVAVHLPDDVESNPDPAVSLSTSETVTQACALDGAAAVACTSPWRPGPVAPGPHTISVVGTDRAGNQSSPASAGWTRSSPAGTPTPTPAATPTVAPDPTAAPAAPPAGQPAAAVGARPGTSVFGPAPVAASPPRPAASTALPALSAAPVVRIAGIVQARSTTVRLLSVRAPRTASVRVECRGRTCPRRSGSVDARGQRPVRVRWLDHARLASGTALTVAVTEAGHVGRWTRFVVRTGRAPSRSDRCLRPGRNAPVRCSGI